MTKVNTPISVVGISTITSNEEAFKQNSIGKLWENFLNSSIKDKLNIQLLSDTIYAVYSDYENEDKGKYKITIGYAIDKTKGIPSELTTVTIPAGNYKTYQSKNQKEDIIASWKCIWDTNPNLLHRNFIVDFEEYSEAEVTIYIGYE